MGSYRALTAAAALAALFGAAGPLAADDSVPKDWPQFRGPHRDGIVAEGPTGWGDAGPKELWRVPLGEGYSAVSVAGDAVFTLYADADSEQLAAFDRTSGAKRWSVRLSPRLDTAMGNGPRSTPTVADGRVFALSGTGVLVAVTAADGTYSIAGLAPNTYRVRLAPPSGSGLSGEWYDDAATRTTATPIAVGSSPITGIDATLD